MFYTKKIFFRNIAKIWIVSLFSLYVPASFAQIQEYTIDLYDTHRSRLIPLAVYSPLKTTIDTQVIFFSHGYDANAGGSYRNYSYLTRFLAEQGYYVISIQYELPDDEPLSMSGDLYITRMPNWERGVENILFSMNEFKKIRPELDWKRAILIGHSNGGDMSMLFATKYPGMIYQAISLDHRRMPIPRVSQPRIASLRGCDYEADKQVIPTTQEQQKLKIRIISLDRIKHGDMDNKGSDSQHQQICESILNFLK